MKTIDYELLKKRREQILKCRAETEQDMGIGLAYTHIIGGRCYPVLASFSVDTNEDSAETKIKYLIKGRKS